MIKQMNLPYETIDTPIYREAWRDLIKYKSTGNVSYREFLKRMDNRNAGIRKREYYERVVEVQNPMIIEAMKETSRTAGNPGTN
jgi:hypothetical protein